MLVCTERLTLLQHSDMHGNIDMDMQLYVCLQGGGGQRGQARTTMERAERGYQHVATSKYAASQ